MHFSLLHQFFVNIIEDPVYKLAALGSAVLFGKVNVLIDGYFWRYGFEI